MDACGSLAGGPWIVQSRLLQRPDPYRPLQPMARVERPEIVGRREGHPGDVGQAQPPATQVPREPHDGDARDHPLPRRADDETFIAVEGVDVPARGATGFVARYATR